MPARSAKDRMIGAGFAIFAATGLHARAARWTRGRGAILTMHHVRPGAGHAFTPNDLLEIEPAFLDAALTLVRRLGYGIVSLDEALRRLGDPSAAPFVALTFDDGFRDLVDGALPVLERHAAPFTAFVTSGFAERTARLWWVELEVALRKLDRVEVAVGDTAVVVDSATVAEKQAAFARLYPLLRAADHATLLRATGDLCAAAGLDPVALVDRLCLDRDGVRALAHHPLATVGAHTIGHPALARLDAAAARHEMAGSRAWIEETIGLPVRHIAYPIGDLGSAGPRDHALAASLGFASGVTTRPGVLFDAHAGRPTALPRISLNGRWQRLDALEILLSGAPFALWNRGRLAA